jgi:hypothetical protein
MRTKAPLRLLVQLAAGQDCEARWRMAGPIAELAEFTRIDVNRPNQALEPAA